MELEKLYDITDKEKISVIPFKMKNKAIIGNIGTTYAIGINYALISNSNEEKTILAEELGHYYTNTLYDNNCSQTEINKREYRATKWAIKTLVPLAKLKELANKGLKYSYEFAEELEVTEDIIEKAYSYYGGF